MKKRILSILIVAFLFSACISSKRIIYLSPVSSTVDSLDISRYETKYSGTDGVFLEVEKNIQHSGNVQWLMGMQQWTYITNMKSKYLILNPKNEQLTTFILPSVSENALQTLYLKTTSPDGKVKMYSKADLIQEKNSSGFSSYKFIYPDVQKGTIVEEAYELVYHVPFVNFTPMKHEILLQYQFPCEKLSFKYAYPKWFDLSIKKTSADGSLNYKISDDEDSKCKVLSYNDSDVPEFSIEPFSPFFKEISKYMQFRIQKIGMGSVNYEAYKDWKEFALELEDFAIDKDGIFYSRIAPVAEELTENCSSETEKLDKIITYIQDNIEVDNNTDRSFGKVLSEKKGDIFTITGMALSMLKKIGIHADYLLIHPSQEGNFDNNYISFDQFSYPALKAELDSSVYIVFPYIKQLPISVIPDFAIGETAMLISGKGNHSFIKIMPESTSENFIENNYELEIDENGRLTVNEVKIIKGYPAYKIRTELQEIKTEENDNFIKSLMSYSGGETNIIDFNIKNREDYKQPLEISINYSIDNLVSITPDEILFQPEGLLSPSSGKNLNFNVENRKNPVRIYHDENNFKNITIKFPTLWKIQSDLKEIKLENSFGTLSRQIDFSEGLLKIVYHYYLKKGIQPKEKINELAELIGTDSGVPAIVFQKNE